jgi:hypothetical protein
VSGSGIVGSGSAWAGIPIQDKQYGFIQNGGKFNQTLSLVAGDYSLEFKTARRSYSKPENSPRSIGVFLDGTQIHKHTPVSTEWGTVKINVTIPVTGQHTFEFAGLDYVIGEDKSTFFDAIVLKLVKESDGSSSIPVIPTNELGVTLSRSNDMYKVEVKGKTEANAAVAGVKVYLGAQVVALTTAPDANFEAAFEVTDAGDLELAYSYVNSFGMEGPKKSQTVTLHAVPPLPGNPLAVTVVWVD